LPYEASSSAFLKQGSKGKKMAKQNLQDAKGTYDGFITLVKWGAGFVAITVAFVVIIIQ
jgi:Bacterial aa3 type cytochrome c oxidase subunit IV